MPIDSTLSITDDSGFLAIVNADKYKTFVNRDWELPELIKHFIDQMNIDALIIWSTGEENYWTVHLVDKPGTGYAFRKFEKTIEVTSGQLFLVNYEDLTMAAQFKDEQIPSKHNSLLSIRLGNGLYNLTISQLFDPTTNDADEDKIHYEIVIQPVSGQSEKIEKIFWSDL